MSARDEAVAAVVEAAEILAGGAGVIRGWHPEGADIYTHELEHIRHLMACLTALSALPADPEPAEATGETVVAFADHGGGVHWAREGCEPSWACGWQRIGAARLQPIPATVEDKS